MCVLWRRICSMEMGHYQSTLRTANSQMLFWRQYEACEIMNTVGPQIRKLRCQRGWSQAQLVAKIQLKGWDLSRESLAKIESRLHKVADTQMRYFAEVLQVSLEDLYPPANGNGFLGDPA